MGLLGEKPLAQTGGGETCIMPLALATGTGEYPKGSDSIGDAAGVRNVGDSDPGALTRERLID